MGLQKQRWMESLEEEATTAEWECPVCEEGNEDQFEIPSVDFSSDSASDYHGEEPFDISCSSCDFHAAGTVTNGVGGLHFVISGPDGESIHIEAPDPRDYYEPDYDEHYWEPSDDPDGDYSVTLEGIRTLLHTSLPIEHDHQLLNRIVFTQTITAVEAFLSDSLINLAKGDVEVQKLIYEKDTELGRKKFTSLEILADPQIPEKYLLTYLREKISFHNFDTANKFFRYVLSQDIFPDDDNRNAMFKAVERRHDCVHRNGRNLNGVKLVCFDQAYVSKIMAEADRLVTKVRHMLIAREFESFGEEE